MNHILSITFPIFLFIHVSLEAQQSNTIFPESFPNVINKVASDNVPYLSQEKSRRYPLSENFFKSVLDSVTAQIWDIAGDSLRNTYNFTYEYDNSEQTITETFKLWTNGIHLNDWIKRDRSYDSYGYESELKQQKWNSNSQSWENEYKYAYINDSIGNIIEEIFLSGLVYDTISKTVYSYNTNGQLSGNQVSNYDLTNNSWLTSSSDSIIYNTLGLKILEEKQVYNSITSGWFLSNKTEYYYDNNNHLERMVSFEKNTTNNQWDTTDIEDFSFSTDGDLLYKITYYNPIGTNTLLKSIKTEYSYDQHKNIVEVKSSNWDNFNQQWSNFYLYENQIDENILNSDLVIAPYYGGETKHKVLSQLHWNWNNNTLSWDTNQIETYHYSDKWFVGMNEKNNFQVSIYPNPTANTLNVSTNIESFNVGLLELFDQKGKKVLAKNIYPHQIIDLQSISAGIFIYKLTIDQNVKHGKIVKQ